MLDKQEQADLQGMSVVFCLFGENQGAGFLALVAIIPTMISSSLGVSFTVASFYGGTGLLIAVSVAFDLVQKIDNHLVMRNYPGLLES